MVLSLIQVRENRWNDNKYGWRRNVLTAMSTVCSGFLSDDTSQKGLVEAVQGFWWRFITVWLTEGRMAGRCGPIPYSWSISYNQNQDSFGEYFLQFILNIQNQHFWRHVFSSGQAEWKTVIWEVIFPWMWHWSKHKKYLHSTPGHFGRIHDLQHIVSFSLEAEEDAGSPPRTNKRRHEGNENRQQG